MREKEKKQALMQELDFLKSEKHREFSKKIMNTSLEVLGVNIPTLKKIARRITKEDIDAFINCYEGKYFEECMLYGLAIAYTNDIEILSKYLVPFSKEIKDWGCCDYCANSMKIIREHQELFKPYIEIFLNSENEFEVRFGLVLLLNHYMNAQYIAYILKVCLSLKSTQYYINMAIAWLLCECYIKFPKQTNQYIDAKYLSKFVLNKTISKISDSYRVSSAEKKALKKRRI